MTTIMHFAGTLQRRPTTLRLPLGVLSRCPACQALPPPGGLLARCAQGQRGRGTFIRLVHHLRSTAGSACRLVGHGVPGRTRRGRAPPRSRRPFTPARSERILSALRTSQVSGVATVVRVTSVPTTPQLMVM